MNAQRNNKEVRPLLLYKKRSGRGPVLVLIHGVAGSGRIWAPVVPLLAKRLTVVQLDLLGYGHSPKPHLEYTPEVHVTAIRATLQHHNIRPPFAVAGLSMGSLLALEYARRWPAEVTQVLCIGLPYYRDAAEARRYLRHSPWARLALEWGGLGRLIIKAAWGLGRRHRWLATSFSRGRMYDPMQAQESAMNTYQAFRTTLLNAMVNNPAEPLVAGAATTPQHYLHGANDRWASTPAVQQLLARYPHCQLTLLPNTDHNTVVFAPEATAAWILGALGVADA
jgi:pimeloyl-ACP methyl ester carboxylesterase